MPRVSKVTHNKNKNEKKHKLNKFFIMWKRNCITVHSRLTACTASLALVKSQNLLAV